MNRLALLMLLLPAVAQAQVTDTITFEVVGTLTEVAIASDIVSPARIGATIQFVAVAVDEDGIPLDVILTWASSNPLVLTIDPQTGLAKAVGKGSARISVLAEPVDRIVVGLYRVENGPEEMTFPFYDKIPLEIEIGGRAQSCAYVLRGDEAVLQSVGSPGSPCPILFPPADIGSPTQAMFPGRRPFRSYDEIRGITQTMRIGDA